MTEPTTMGRRARNQLVRLELDEARSHGLARRHLLKLQRLAETNAGHGSDCGEQTPHRHTCSYDDVISLLSATASGGPESPP